ncbi:MAG: sigma-70 family RNA polymerase sigma factor [Longispora sp.]|nr:sigma-70 family RNA polymerase sigma factor [Longispora sp. (in: high G+C Gram-positive bacteria)]
MTTTLSAAPPTSALSDPWQLIERAQGGDLAAFNGLYERYSEKIFWTVYFRVRNWHLAEDISQHVWVRALGAVHRWRNIGCDPIAFLMTIAINLVADYFKSSRNRHEVFISDALDTKHEEQADSNDPSPESIAMFKDIRATLLAAINRLSAEQRECLMLRFYSDFSSREIAWAMGKSEGAVKALQYRAVRTLARRLDGSWLSHQHFL